MSEPIATIVLGATGYVGGELLRLIAGHPQLQCTAAVSRETETKIAEQFPHIAPLYPDTSFIDIDSALAKIAQLSRVAVFSAAPHGSSALMIARCIEAADTADCEIHCVDASADFRFSSASDFADVYGVEHGAPALLKHFCSSVPEHWDGELRQHAGNPGCFASAMLIASLPLLKADLTEGDLFAAGVTGSTGSGKSPLPTTHHPFRHANLYTYKPLAHRHVPEVRGLLKQASGQSPQLNFVPHSGPFARGIHMTVQAHKANGVTLETAQSAFQTCYRDSIFIQVQANSPQLKDVVGSNYARVAVHVSETSVAVTCVIDNLIKGAAGSAMQWMNKLYEFPEAAGLQQTALGYS